jgi:flagellar hook assembly protein FlgD
VNGRAVRQLIDGRLDAGFHQALWDGNDDRARSVASGIYFMRLVALDAVRSAKIVVLR